MKLLNRIKKQKNSINNNQNQEIGALDIINEMRYQEVFFKLKINIDLSSEAHLDFWTQLIEEAPDLQKVYLIGRKIYKYKIKVQENWNKLSKICNKRSKSIILYANYLMDILYDNHQGQQLLNQVNFINQIDKSNIKNINTQEKNSDSQPIIIISLETDKLGLIINTNLSSCAFFGYTKTELINKKLNTLMPSLYSNFHDSFLENYLNNNELTTLKDERYFFTFHKSTYIIPAYLNVKAFESLTNGQQMIGQFRQDRSLKNVCYFLVNESGIITSITPTCISYLSIDYKQMQQKENILDVILPNLWRNKNEYMIKQGHVFNFKPHQNFGGIPGFKNGIQQFITFKASIQEIIVLKDQLLGYIVKLEMDKSKIKTNQNNDACIKNHQNSKNQYMFQFQIQNSIFLGEFVIQNYQDQESNNNLEFKTNKLNTQTVLSISNQQLQTEELQNQSILPFQKNQDIQEEVEQQLYFKNSNIKPTLFHKICIRTMRLYKNRLSDISQFKDSDDENSDNNEEEYEYNSTYKNGMHFNEENMKLNKNLEDNFYQKQKINDIINTPIISVAIKFLNILIKILLFILLSLSIIEYIIVLNQLDYIKKFIQLINYSNKRLADLNYVEGNIRDLVLLNMGLYTENEIGKESKIKEEIKKKIENIDKMTSFLQLNTDNYISGDFFNILHENNIKMYLNQNQYEFRDINDSTQQMIANALFIANNKLENIKSDNKDVFFFTFNIFNFYQIQLQKSNFYYIRELMFIVMDKNNILFIILILTPVFIIIDLLLFLPVLIYANKQSMQIIYLFLEIPNNQIQVFFYLIFKLFIQIFLKNSIYNYNAKISYFKQEKRKKKNLLILQKKIYLYINLNYNQIKDNSYQITIQILIGIIIFEVYFIANYFLTQNLFKNIYQYIPEMNYTMYAESLYSFTDNVQRRIFIDPKAHTLDKDSIQVCLQNIRDLFKLDSDILYEHSQNINIHSQQYNAEFVQIMIQSICPYLKENNIVNNIEECNNFANGTIKSGMSVAFIRYFENIRQLLTYYQQIQENNISFFPKDFIFKNLFNEKNKNFALNLLRLPIAEEIKQMQNVYIQNALRKLVLAFQTSIENQVNEQAQIKFILFLIFIFLIFLFYFFFWYPIQYFLTDEIFKTRSLLTAIPLQIIKKVKPILFYIQYLYQIQQEQQKKEQLKNKQFEFQI
ncbi:PAS domain S-box family protein [Ichthyophthirius multifiliis]|uniref:PAS domain S-box family protein n=1 Tax=Ichthyophthirius multifiliis TaxID=5932 RepID=G0QL36_ICHMU|nr:PAS domain S-box family protein [Ichthyophthirius multifiliis]EGR34069.1 PAS domain S-box family protein [Ichthyophthirius multifiliis]|eukprot:XP_004039373.1 PAS domain S-box family protein [Ichthyophthirius multifiliis]